MSGTEPANGTPMRVAETFEMTGRGLAVIVAETTDLPASTKLIATVVRPNGSSLKAEAFKERSRKLTSEPLEGEAFLLMGLIKADVPVSSELHLRISD